MIDLRICVVLAEESAFGLGEDADDGELGAIQHEGPAHRVAIGEKGLGDVEAEHGHMGPRSFSSSVK